MIVPEARENNGKIFLNGYFKATLIGFASFVVFGFAFIGTNVIANDKDSRSRDEKIMEIVMKNTLAIQKIGSIERDVGEIKDILKKATKYGWE